MGSDPGKERQWNEAHVYSPNTQKDERVITVHQCANNDTRRNKAVLTCLPRSEEDLITRGPFSYTRSYSSVRKREKSMAIKKTGSRLVNMLQSTRLQIFFHVWNSFSVWILASRITDKIDALLTTYYRLPGYPRFSCSRVWTQRFVLCLKCYSTFFAIQIYVTFFTWTFYNRYKILWKFFLVFHFLYTLIDKV